MSSSEIVDYDDEYRHDVTEYEYDRSETGKQGSKTLSR